MQQKPLCGAPCHIQVERVQALVGVARMVAALHAAGYVHRNIKPTNVLRHLTKHEWVVSDYATTAPIGVHPLLCPLFESCNLPLY